MMNFYHGIKTTEKSNTIITPITASSGITFVVGTAPVHTVLGDVNKPIVAHSYNEAISKLGYSDDFEKYTLCEIMYTHFKIYKVSPVVFVNVLDPLIHKKAVLELAHTVVDGNVLLPFDTIKDSVTVKNGSDTLICGTDYELFYNDNKLVVAIIAELNEVLISYDIIDSTMVDFNDIIGGFDVDTKKYTGFETLDNVFALYSIIPDLLISPKFSSNPEVASVMSGKAENINSLFSAKAIIDIDSSMALHFDEAVKLKEFNNMNSKHQIVCYPKCKFLGKTFHMSSHMAGLMASIDNMAGSMPVNSPSNKDLVINSTVLANGDAISINLDNANYLNSNGIVTAINFIGGFKLWGNHTACFPKNNDFKDCFINVSRMFSWVSTTVILTYWSRIDSNLTRRFIDSILDFLNTWLNGLILFPI